MTTNPDVKPETPRIQITYDEGGCADKLVQEKNSLAFCSSINIKMVNNGVDVPSHLLLLGHQKWQ